jgi:hypothetical protein
MRLYWHAGVESAEASVEFQEMQAKRQPRRDAAQRALETKRQTIADYVENLEISVPCLSRKELIERACNSYNANREGGSRAVPDAEPAFLERICVNYLRHCLTEYERHLEEIAGKVGTREAYLEVKSKVLDAIAAEYDWLADECRRQEKRMWDEYYRSQEKVVRRRRSNRRSLSREPTTSTRHHNSCIGSCL